VLSEAEIKTASAQVRRRQAGARQGNARQRATCLAGREGRGGAAAGIAAARSRASVLAAAAPPRRKRVGNGAFALGMLIRRPFSSLARRRARAGRCVVEVGCVVGGMPPPPPAASHAIVPLPRGAKMLQMLRHAVAAPPM